tara:strand:+ start:59 stop:991 length:933 start_codon:yes stop_codon:yes gene_type:complete
LKAVVRKSTGSWYEIETDEGEVLEARLKGKMRTLDLKSTNPVAVGDRVIFEKQGEEALIKDIEERKNYLIRRSINLSKQTQIIAANIDQLFVLITLKDPVTFKGFVDRVLVGAEAYRIPAVLLYNKVDLFDEKDKEELKSWIECYQKAGYEQMQISATEGIGIDELKAKMKGKVSIFSGHSGVGKSTLINALDPELDLRVGEISDYHRSGQHTTTYAELHTLAFGGRIVDTPGIKGFGNVNMDKEVLSHYFPEMRARMKDCKFNNCLHIKEPNCAIKEAVAAGEIAESRYFNYLSIYEEDVEETFRSKGY